MTVFKSTQGQNAKLGQRALRTDIPDSGLFGILESPLTKLGIPNCTVADDLEFAAQ